MRDGDGPTRSVWKGGPGGAMLPLLVASLRESDGNKRNRRTLTGQERMAQVKKDPWGLDCGSTQGSLIIVGSRVCHLSSPTENPLTGVCAGLFRVRDGYRHLTGTLQEIR